jgi:hypothetical protein
MKRILIFSISLLITSCKTSKTKCDAYGCKEKNKITIAKL